MSSKCYYIVFGLLLTCFASPLNAQFSFNAGIESGVYNSLGDMDETGNLLVKLNGQINYLHRTDKTNARALFEINPQFYGFDNTFNAVKLKAEVSYSQQFDSFNWGIDLLKRNYYYSSDTYDSAFDIYYLQTSLNWRLNSSTPVQTILGLAYQDIDNDISQNADLIFLDNKISHRFDLYSQMNYGLYVEKYVITTTAKNSGWRLGPQVGFNHMKKFIIKADYRFLSHFSNITKEFSYEHWLRLLIGKLLDDKWSIFLMADYNIKNIETDSANASLAYSLIDAENHVYLKLAYDYSEHLELSLKGGYFNENYFIADTKLKGWNATFGIKYKY